ncbi:TspO/MBR family protein [Virgibacillus halodenitrificans]|uniref:TspO/MBR family protein n=1 Tax=Virgibacillus halodenitrificans TaxID=1482 RepID=UPI000EF4AAE6|nr:TspO/MBR family protein [Virgibacillus halodenitrificans]
MEIFKVNGTVNKKRLAIGVLIPVVGGALVGYYANKDTQAQYKKLKKPAFSPPPRVFPIAWTSLYSMMGLAQYRAYEKVDTSQIEATVLTPYSIQLGLNFLWSFLFFKWNLRGAALLEIGMMMAAIGWSATQFYKVDRLAGALMLPYLGWVGFASTLNYSIWKLNR